MTLEILDKLPDDHPIKKGLIFCAPKKQAQEAEMKLQKQMDESLITAWERIDDKLIKPK